MGDYPEGWCRCHPFVSYLYVFRCDRAHPISGDFTLYDHLLDHSFNFGVVPQRYVEQKLSPLDTYFGMYHVQRVRSILMLIP